MKQHGHVSMLCFIACLSALIGLSGYAYCQEKMGEAEVNVQLDYLPELTRPGDKPISLNSKILSMLLPERKNVRLMTFNDLVDSYEQDDFIEGGYSFVLRGDFNRDGHADLAFVGKCQSEYDDSSKLFLAVVSIVGQIVKREYLDILDVGRASLLLIPNYKQSSDGILMSYTIASDWCEVLYWDGKKYVGASCNRP